MGEFGIVLEVTAIHINSTSRCSPPLAVECPDDSISLRRSSQSCGALPALWSTDDSATSSSSRSTSVDSEYSLELHQQLRSTMANHVTRDDNIIRYAVKQLRKDVYPKKKTEACKDLAREAKFLASLQHPNIVRLRAIVSKPGNDQFMLVLDRLRTTLSEQVKMWGKDSSHQQSSLHFPWPGQQRRQQEHIILSERLMALYDVAQAMRYLHQNA